jgi:hypothetical protein
MGPRCKPGDLAIVVKSTLPQNIGMIVKVVRAVPQPYFGMNKGLMFKLSEKCGFWWEIDREVTLIDVISRNPYDIKFIVDEALQPIRPPSVDTSTHSSVNKTFKVDA